MKKPIPKSITIFGVRFKIEVVDLSADSLCGDSSLSKKLIRIDSNDTIEEQRSTLFHECIHMSLHISGLNELLENKEEAIVICIENALFKLLEFK